MESPPVSKGDGRMEPFTRIEDALAYAESYEGAAEDFTLLISDSLLDPMGANMAIITDKVLKKGFMPNGFEQKAGYRVCKYKTLE
jgi:hypothetical protein